MIVQNIVWPAESLFASEREVYFRSEPRSVRAGEGCLLLAHDSEILFNTYYNILPFRKWYEYTGIREFFFEFTLSGDVSVEIHAIRRREHYSTEKPLVSKRYTVDGKSTHRLSIPFSEDVYDAVYVRIYSYGTPASLFSAGFGVHDACSQKIDLACCVCTYNRQEYVRKIISVVADGIERTRLPIRLLIANNGSDLGFDVPDFVGVFKNRNLGGAGGFTRSAMEAVKQGATHVIFMDDDIDLSFESVFRVFRFFERCLPEKRDVFLSGSMLSSDERWLQYERNTVVSDGGFHHQGHAMDLRTYSAAIENAVAPSIRGVAGWWFCAFSAHMLRDHGLPLPVFVRGDDIEFSLRCGREIVSMNGVCVWHDPFWFKYSELMEDYYLPRNMIINAFMAHRPLWGLAKVFVLRKFIKNLLCMNYVASRMNMMAITHVMDGTYKSDPASLHVEMAALLKAEKSRVKFIKIPMDETAGGRSRFLFISLAGGLLVLLGVFRGDGGVSRYGFGRRIMDFLGRREVRVFDKLRGGADLAVLDRREFWCSLGRFLVLYSRLMMRRGPLRKSLIAYRREAISPQSWEKLFESDAS
jgi:GT2 family glycosyltransferase